MELTTWNKLDIQSLEIL